MLRVAGLLTEPPSQNHTGGRGGFVPAEHKHTDILLTDTNMTLAPCGRVEAENQPLHCSVRRLHLLGGTALRSTWGLLSVLTGVTAHLFEI